MKTRKIALHWQILIGIAAGALAGIFLPTQVGHINWVGTIFLRALSMIAIPLIFTSVFGGVIAQERPPASGR